MNNDLISRSWVVHNVLSLMDAETRIYAEQRLYTAPAVEEIADKQAVDMYQIRKAYERGFETGSAVGITEEQAINKLHETGWLPNHDREMTTRPQGKWEHDKLFGECAYVCSFCHTIWTSSEIQNMHFCPNCGADMRGSAE